MIFSVAHDYSFDRQQSSEEQYSNPLSQCPITRNIGLRDECKKMKAKLIFRSYQELSRNSPRWSIRKFSLDERERNIWFSPKPLAIWSGWLNVELDTNDNLDPSLTYSLCTHCSSVSSAWVQRYLFGQRKHRSLQELQWMMMGWRRRSRLK